MQEAITDVNMKESVNSPLQRVGKFLKGSKNIYVTGKGESKQIHESHSSIKLYSAPMLSQRQLLYIICEEYAEKEELSLKSHLILICTSDTSGNELQQFFKRAKTFIDKYIIIGFEL